MHLNYILEWIIFQFRYITPETLTTALLCHLNIGIYYLQGNKRGIVVTAFATTFQIGQYPLTSWIHHYVFSEVEWSLSHHNFM